MARQRMHKPELVSHVPFLECSVIGRLLFIQLQNFCDDHGNHPFSVRAIKAEVFPADDFTVAQIEGLIDELIKKGLLAKYTAGNQQYLHILGWEIEGHPCYQVINKPQPSTYPKYDEFATTGTLPEPLPEQSGLIEDKINEDKIKENNMCAGAPESASPPVSVSEKKSTYPELFERWWGSWFIECVNKGSKPQTHERWRTLTKKNPGLAEEMISALERQKQQILDCRKYGVWVSHPRQPLVWLRQSGWTDEMKTEEQIRGLAPKPQGFNQPVQPSLTAEQRAANEAKHKADQAERDETIRKRETRWQTQYPDVFKRFPVTAAWAECQRLDKQNMAKTA